MCKQGKYTRMFIVALLIMLGKYSVEYSYNEIVIQNNLDKSLWCDVDEERS